MSTESLLIELRTEELPPKALNLLGESFAASIIEQLQKDFFIAETADYKVFASPRRLGVLVKNVVAMQADQQVVKKGPSVANGMKDGEPTKALLGFARGAISVTERATYIGRVRALSRTVAQKYVESREALGYPLLKNQAANTAA